MGSAFRSSHFDGETENDQTMPAGYNIQDKKTVFGGYQWKLAKKVLAGGDTGSQGM